MIRKKAGASATEDFHPKDHQQREILLHCSIGFHLKSWQCCQDSEPKLWRSLHTWLCDYENMSCPEIAPWNPVSQKTSRHDLQACFFICYILTVGLTLKALLLFAGSWANPQDERTFRGGRVCRIQTFCRCPGPGIDSWTASWVPLILFLPCSAWWGHRQGTGNTISSHWSSRVKDFELRRSWHNIPQSMLLAQATRATWATPKLTVLAGRLSMENLLSVKHRPLVHLLCCCSATTTERNHSTPTHCMLTLLKDWIEVL